MNVKFFTGSIPRSGLCAALGLLLFKAIAQMPAPGTIPDPADGPYLFVAPLDRVGSVTVSASMTGLDATAVHRAYDLPFDTKLTSSPSGFVFVIR